MNITHPPKPNTIDRRRPNRSRPLPTRRFDPTATGMGRWFGPTEKQIMLVLWEKGSSEMRPTTVKSVWTTVVEDFSHEVAYTTIMTTMARLAKNGFLDRFWDTGAYYYYPRETKDEFLARNKALILGAIDEDEDE